MEGRASVGVLLIILLLAFVILANLGIKPFAQEDYKQSSVTMSSP